MKLAVPQCSKQDNFPSLYVAHFPSFYGLLSHVTEGGIGLPANIDYRGTAGEVGE